MYYAKLQGVALNKMAIKGGKSRRVVKNSHEQHSSRIRGY